MNSPRILMTKGEYAAHAGVGKSAVSNWTKSKLLVFGECPVTGAMKVDVERSDARRNAKVDPGRGRPTKAMAAPQGDLPLQAPRAEPVRNELADVRTELIRQQTAKHQLDNAKRAGELVLLSDYARRASEGARAARERMHSLIRTNAEWLASVKDPRAIVTKMAEDIDAAFNALADQMAAGTLVEDVEEIDAVAEAVADQVMAEAAADDAEDLEAAG